MFAGSHITLGIPIMQEDLHQGRHSIEISLTGSHHPSEETHTEIVDDTDHEVAARHAGDIMTRFQSSPQAHMILALPEQPSMQLLAVAGH